MRTSTLHRARINRPRYQIARRATLPKPGHALGLNHCRLIQSRARPPFQVAPGRCVQSRAADEAERQLQRTPTALVYRRRLGRVRIKWHLTRAWASEEIGCKQCRPYRKCYEILQVVSGVLVRREKCMHAPPMTPSAMAQFLLASKDRRLRKGSKVTKGSEASSKALSGDLRTQKLGKARKATKVICLPH
jgi:hypothetical protein